MVNVPYCDACDTQDTLQQPLITEGIDRDSWWAPMTLNWSDRKPVKGKEEGRKKETIPIPA